MLDRGREKGRENPYEVTLEYFYNSKGTGGGDEKFLQLFCKFPFVQFEGHKYIFYAAI